ncbi:MAG: hypothetical protein NUV45_14960 [Tepidanaerobacteraceae bacterium]|nr:hypothetical protein [Tepidanaerobacteraceae bacterium]
MCIGCPLPPFIPQKPPVVPEKAPVVPTRQEITKKCRRNNKKNHYKIVPRNIKITSQKVKETIKDNGDTTTSYVAYVMADVSAIPMSSGGGTEEPYDYDDSYSTTTYVKVTYQYNHFTRNSIE